MSKQGKSESSAPNDENVSSPIPVTRRQRARALADMMGRFGRISIAGGIIALSVFSLVWNLMAFRAEETEGSNWFVASIAIVVTCVVPLVLGFLMLFRSLSNES